MLDRDSCSGQDEVSDQDEEGSLLGGLVTSDHSTDICESSLVEEGGIVENERCQLSGFHSLFCTAGIIMAASNGSSGVTPPAGGVSAPAKAPENHCRGFKISGFLWNA